MLDDSARRLVSSTSCSTFFYDCQLGVTRQIINTESDPRQVQTGLLLPPSAPRPDGGFPQIIGP